MKMYIYYMMHKEQNHTKCMCTAPDANRMMLSQVKIPPTCSNTHTHTHTHMHVHACLHNNTINHTISAISQTSQTQSGVTATHRDYITMAGENRMQDYFTEHTH